MKTRNYVIRDLILWFLLLIVLPAVIFTVYYLITNAQFHANITVSNGTGNVEKSKISSLSDQSQAQIAAEKHQQHGQELMKRFLLSEALCNDGSPASYYIKRSSKSSSMWVIVLEGGYFCYDVESCRSRAINSANLTSSRLGKRFKRGRGILASRVDENPYWHDANLV